LVVTRIENAADHSPHLPIGGIISITPRKHARIKKSVADRGQEATEVGKITIMLRVFDFAVLPAEVDANLQIAQCGLLFALTGAPGSLINGAVVDFDPAIPAIGARRERRGRLLPRIATQIATGPPTTGRDRPRQALTRIA
jgi:hypothetical protein